MRVMITGAAGFVASYAARAINQLIPEATVVGTTRDGAMQAGFNEIVALDLADAAAIQAALEEVKPTHVLHLAGIAAPPAASADPAAAWCINTLGTLAFGRAILAVDPKIILLNAGSASAYGDSANGLDRIDEDTAFSPIDEYGATKAAADLGLGALVGQGLNVVRLRPFNHIGPGQTEDYAIPAFAAQIAAIEKGLREPVVKVGNLEAERDLCDVQDVARAYAMVAAAASQDSIPRGRAYNICSGRGIRMSAALDLLLSMSSFEIEIRQDPARMRPSNIPRLVGNPRRAELELSWRATRPIEATLREILEDWRDKTPH